MSKKGLEACVGLFLLLGLLCLAYVSIYLGDINLFGRSTYTVYATFSNVAGLNPKAAVMMAGVHIGRVDNVYLKNAQALVALSINKGVQLEDDSIASVKTMGLIGDKYVSISAGASEKLIPAGGTIRDTQPPIDIEDLIGKFVFGKVGG